MNSVVPEVDYYSACSIPVQGFFNDKPISTATAFFYKIEKRFALVTNWHVLSGRHPDTGQPLDEKNGSVPNVLELSVHLEEVGSTAHHIRIPLFKSDGTPLWHQHKEFGQRVDVAVINIAETLYIEAQGKRLYVKMYSANEGDPKHLAMAVGDDVFVVGYPLGLRVRAIFPIWKRGSIATEPSFDLNDLPLMYIDCATRSGMSGSPVYRRDVGLTRLDNGSFEMRMQTTTELIGVYSGRFKKEDEYGRQVGRLWKRRCIDEIATHGVLGSYQIVSA
jgi:hypothetical protein